MAKKAHKNKKVSKVWELYENGKPKAKTCPKCGAGVYMATHKNRSHCGKCGYTEFN